MSTSTASTINDTAATSIDFGLIRRQIAGILRLELRRNLLGRRAFGLYFMAFSPVFLVLIGVLFTHATERYESITQFPGDFAIAFKIYLQISLFLSALFMFMSAFRAEILERSLHYYFLVPIRREVLVLGKYLPALLATGGTFVVSTSMFYVLMCLQTGTGATRQYLLEGPGLGHVAAYAGTVLLACAGYGALFLLAGLVFRNPVVPALIIWVWEAISLVLPAFFKRLSVIFYLRSFYPVPVAEDGFFAIIAEPPSAWASVIGLLLFTAFVLFLASWRARRLEINYGAD